MPFPACKNQIPIYTLMFTPADLSTWKIFTVKTHATRLTPIQQRQAYWANNVVLDGRYPALVWEHEFMATQVNSNPIDYYKSALALYQTPPVNGNLAPLILQTAVGGTTYDVVNYGNCYLEDTAQSQPGEFLIAEAGMQVFKFLGTVLPSVVI